MAMFRHREVLNKRAETLEWDRFAETELKSFLSVLAVQEEDQVRKIKKSYEFERSRLLRILAALNETSVQNTLDASVGSVDAGDAPSVPRRHLGSHTWNPSSSSSSSSYPRNRANIKVHDASDAASSEDDPTRGYSLSWATLLRRDRVTAVSFTKRPSKEELPENIYIQRKPSMKHQAAQKRATKFLDNRATKFLDQRDLSPDDVDGENDEPKRGRQLPPLTKATGLTNPFLDPTLDWSSNDSDIDATLKPPKPSFSPGSSPTNPFALLPSSPSETDLLTKMSDTSRSARTASAGRRPHGPIERQVLEASQPVDVSLLTELDSAMDSLLRSNFQHKKSASLDLEDGEENLSFSDV